MAEPKGNIEKNMKDELLEAAARLFRRKGFDGTSMQDIAKEVGILKGSIYYHFSSKNEIFREVLTNGIDPVLKISTRLLQESLSPRAKLEKFLRNHLGYIMEHNDSLVIFFQEREKIPSDKTESYLHKRDRYEWVLRSILEEGVKDGDFPQVDVTLTTFSILGMCNWIIQWYDPGGPKTPQEITDHYLQLICDRMLKPD